ncbi:hypothetical protein J1N35_007709 [Gossypium stocksii]|uniref:Uncharacterized protein n=1 Tax=Gossypium stocksii TaxID=47602 RepID=A0A9D4AFX3_9ROSI|nr:hypothetical protein J1N35_007709 [Gossypium stocksii]
MWQFRCTQGIPPLPQDLDNLHKIDLRSRLEEDWSRFHKKYIECSSESITACHIYYRMGKGVGNVVVGASLPPTKPYYMSLLPATPMYLVSPTIPTFYPKASYAIPYSYLSIMSQRTPTSLLYRDESSSQPPINTMADVRWALRTQMHSTMEERDEDRDQY